MYKDKLAESAIEAKNLSYSPYSNFRVGVALLTKSGEIFQGTNVENAAYGLTMCAERTAIYNALIHGEKNFISIAIAGDAKEFTPPCGSCRQVMLELCGKDLEVLLVSPDKKIKSFKLVELIPFSFGDEHLTL